MITARTYLTAEPVVTILASGIQTEATALIDALLEYKPEVVRVRAKVGALWKPQTHFLRIIGHAVAYL